MPNKYDRKYPLFALCGLNCGLCVNFVGNTKPEASFRCPGCGGDAFCNAHGSCSLFTCAEKHGGVEYCYECSDFPCEHYTKECDNEFFLVCRNARKDLERAGQMGVEAYVAEQEEKVAILQHLLEHYNDGRRKTFFCVAVNLLDLADIKAILTELTPETPPKEVVKHFEDVAKERGQVLKLIKKK